MERNQWSDVERDVQRSNIRGTLDSDRLVRAGLVDALENDRVHISIGDNLNEMFRENNVDKRRLGNVQWNRFDTEGGHISIHGTDVTGLMLDRRVFVELAFADGEWVIFVD